MRTISIFFAIVLFGAGNFLPLRTNAVGPCNNNTLCEGFEDASCVDCQCTGGVVCGGLCYSNLKKTTCRDDILISTDHQFQDNFCLSLNACPKGRACTVPGPCRFGPSLAVQFNFPARLTVHEVVEGNVVMRNTGTDVLQGELKWAMSDLLATTKDMKDPQIVYPRFSLPPDQTLDIPLRVQGKIVSRGADVNALQAGFLEIVAVTPDIGEGMMTYRYEPYIIDPSTAQRCGDYLWNTSGICVGNIFLPGGDCKFGKGCIGRVSGWNSSYQDVIQAKGTKTVRVIAIDIPKSDRARVTTKSVQSLFKQVNDWYAREAKRIVKRPIVKFAVRFDGHYQLRLKDYTFEGVDSLRTYLQKKTRQSFKKSDIVVVIVPVLPKVDLSDAAGMALGDGTILIGLGLRGYESGFNAEALSHELAHLFGCKDIYDTRYLCNYQWNKSLLCAGVWTPAHFGSAPDMNTNPFNRRVLGNCAAEMGWGDQDNDGILDIDDPVIDVVAPVGFPGIAIKDFQTEKGVREVVFANVQSSMSEDSLVLRGTVVEQGTDEPVAARVEYLWKERNELTDEIRGQRDTCLTEGARFVCIIYRVREPQTITVRASVDRFAAEEHYLYKP